MDDVRQLLALVADPPGPTASPPVEALLRRARRREAVRRHGRVAGAVLAVLAVAAPVALIAGARSPGPVEPPAVPASAAGTASVLAAGQWSELPPAPVPGRRDAASAWTGRQLVVWGGVRGDDDLRADGAAYDPTEATWQVLPAAPLDPVTAPLSTWTGSQFLVLGGSDATGTVRQQFAAYDPDAGRWTRLDLPDELRLDRLTAAAWTGSEWVVISEQWAAAYDPGRERWRRLDAPPRPDGHDPVSAVAAAHDGGVLLFTGWWSTTRTGPDTLSGWAGVDVARLDPTGRWEVAQAEGAPDGVGQALSTPAGLLVPAQPAVCAGPCPMRTGLAGWRLADGDWSRLPPGPVDDLRGRSVWTGSALVTADTGAYLAGPGGQTLPGAAAAYDPVSQTWTRLPAAPVVSTGGALAWTGSQLLLWGEVADVAGYDPGSTGRPVRSGGVALTPPTDPSPCPTGGDGALVDYVDLAVVEGRSYVRVGPAPAGAALGGTVATTRCRLADTDGRTGRQPQDGDATLLPVGTELRAVDGFDPRFRLAATVDGATSLYELFEPPVETGTGEDVFPGLREHVVAVSLLSQQDGRTELGREDDPAAVRDIVDQLLAAPYRRESDPEADVRLALRLDDGTTVDRAYVTAKGLLLPGLRLPDRLRAQLDALRG